MDSVRGLNLIQFWISENRDEKELHQIESLCNGALLTTIPPKVDDPGARKLPPVPWWWGSDDIASASSMKAIQEIHQ